MAENQNPFQLVLQTYEKFAKCIQTHIFPISSSTSSSSTTPLESHPMLAQYNIVDKSPKKPNSATPVTKEELGRATWTLLHTLAAQFDTVRAIAIRKVLIPEIQQLPNFGYVLHNENRGLNAEKMINIYSPTVACYPDHPTRQQKRDVKELMAILSRLYPCKECANHFKEVLSVNPVQAGSQPEFSQWLCHVHNVVNRSLGKLVFPCQRVDARWGKLDCPERACDLEGSTKTFDQ